MSDKLYEKSKDLLLEQSGVAQHAEAAKKAAMNAAQNAAGGLLGRLFGKK